ncbi:hypothetical protein [Arenimonas sp.]|uniref:LpxL/LpxP family acyltransferase n=1 Tax=Arenimonas sp. TaxID=1872635 RepID=UPI0035B3CEBA
MTQALLVFALYLLRPLRRSDRRWMAIEWLLGLDLSADELGSVRAACAAAGKPLGAYYYWKLTQVAQSMTFRKLDKRATLALIARCDGTDYAAFEPCLDDPRGMLVATPHHGAFVFSIVALAERIRQRRPVFVFYEAPEAHAANQIFDILYQRLFADPSSGVTVLHNNRNGLATAIRQLRQGAFVVIMPDVYKGRENTYQVPFCGRSRNVMLGTAVLARRTGTAILPMLSDPSDAGLGFRTRFGTRIEPVAGDAQPEADGQVQALCADYRVTAELFAKFEAFMGTRLLHWQYCRGHFLGDPAPPRLEGEEFTRLSALFLQDPRVRIDPVAAMAPGLQPSR